MIARRVQAFTGSVIREMTRINNQYGGVNLQYGGVNLAQDMPNFRPPAALLEAAHRAIDGDFHQYAITWGTPRLRRAIADKYGKFYGTAVEPDRHVTVCCGSTETMLATLTDVAHFLREHDLPDDTAFAMFLVKEIGVATVPGSSFYAHRELGRTKVRFCFPKTDDLLLAAGERLQKLRA